MLQFQKFAQTNQVVAGFVPVDMSSADNTGDWVNLKDYNRCTVIFFKGAGTAGDDPTLTLEQAQNVGGTGVKALNFGTVAVKQGTLTSVGQYTHVSKAAGNTYTDATSAEVQAIWIVEIHASMMDVNNGFTCLRASVADVGENAQLGCLLYILHDPRFGGAELTSAIV